MLWSAEQTPGNRQIIRWEKRKINSQIKIMNRKFLKICASFAVCVCLAAMFFISQKDISTVSADSVLPPVKFQKAETRCGWLVNPTPANVWFYDKDGEWTIGVQGGYQAEGDWAEFNDKQWVKTNVNYGYGCTCMSVTTDKSEMKILTISNAKARPLSACRKDKKLKEPK